MSLYVVVHNMNVKDMRKAMMYVQSNLRARFPLLVDVFSEGYIKLGQGITIDFRCGYSYERWDGLCPDYYITDGGDIFRKVLEDRSAKCGGKELHNLDQVILAAKRYYLDIQELDRMLFEEAGFDDDIRAGARKICEDYDIEPYKVVQLLKMMEP